MSTLRISNIEAKSVPASATVDEKVKITNSSGDTLVFIDGKTSGITTVGINTTDSNITFDANSNIVVTGIVTATKFVGEFEPTSLEIGSNIKLGNAGVITATSFVGSGANLTNLPTQVTINTNADNRVITGGSGVNLYGESGLTFSSDRLILASTSTPQIRINNQTNDSSGTRFVLGKATATNNFFNGAVSGDSCIGFPSDLLFGIGSSEKLRIDNYGVLRVGNTLDQTTSGNTKRISLGAKASIWGWASGQINGALTLADNYYWDGSNNKVIESDYCAYLSLRSGSMRFGCTAASQTGGNNVSGGIHEKVRFENDGNVSIADGNLSFANGHGIDFSNKTVTGDQGTSSSRILDDYEEGDWTCTLSGTGGGSITASRAGYTKIGNLVVCEASFINPGNNSVSGNWSMTLPFQFIGAGSGSYGGGQVTYTRYVPALTSGFQSYSIFTYYGQGSCYLRKLATNGSSETQSHGGSVNNSMLFSFTMSYITGT